MSHNKAVTLVHVFLSDTKPAASCTAGHDAAHICIANVNHAPAILHLTTDVAAHLKGIQKDQSLRERSASNTWSSRL